MPLPTIVTIMIVSTAAAAAAVATAARVRVPVVRLVVIWNVWKGVHYYRNITKALTDSENCLKLCRVQTYDAFYPMLVGWAGSHDCVPDSHVADRCTNKKETEKVILSNHKQTEGQLRAYRLLS